jgi:hypothetical protein
MGKDVTTRRDITLKMNYLIMDYIIFHKFYKS